MLFGVHCLSGFLATWTGNLLERFDCLLTHAQGEIQDRIHVSLRSHPNIELMIQSMLLESMTQKDICSTL